MSKESINLTLAGWENEEIWDTEGRVGLYRCEHRKEGGNNFRFAVAPFSLRNFLAPPAKVGKRVSLRAAK